jgi:hypothetical protein
MDGFDPIHRQQYNVQETEHTPRWWSYGCQIHDMANKLHRDGNTRTDVLACVLRAIVVDLKIADREYMIIAGYCLRDFREVSDLDVVVSTDAFKILTANIGNSDEAKISGGARLVLAFPDIDKDAEIEFFPKDHGIGFPTNDFSMAKLQQDGRLIKDRFGNPYYNIEACVAQYSAVTKQGNQYKMGEFEIDIARINKNISHMGKIKDYLDSKHRELADTIEMVNANIRKLTEIIE